MAKISAAAIFLFAVASQVHSTVAILKARYGMLCCRNKPTCNDMVRINDCRDIEATTDDGVDFLINALGIPENTTKSIITTDVVTALCDGQTVELPPGVTLNFGSLGTHSQLTPELFLTVFNLVNAANPDYGQAQVTSTVACSESEFKDDLHCCLNEANVGQCKSRDNVTSCFDLVGYVARGQTQKSLEEVAEICRIGDEEALKEFDQNEQFNHLKPFQTGTLCTLEELIKYP